MKKIPEIEVIAREVDSDYILIVDIENMLSLEEMNKLESGNEIIKSYIKSPYRMFKESSCFSITHPSISNFCKDISKYSIVENTMFVYKNSTRMTKKDFDYFIAILKENGKKFMEIRKKEREKEKSSKTKNFRIKI